MLIVNKEMGAIPYQVIIEEVKMKCVFCNSCYKRLIVDNQLYYYCTLCRQPYRMINGNLLKVTDIELIEKIRLVAGNRI